MARLEDVARAAGVSASTVSRALSRPDMISESTRHRVLAAAEELGYRHNAAARALVTGRTGLLAFSVPSLANPFYAPVIAGAQEAAEKAGCELIVVVTDGSPEREKALMDRLADRVDGFAAAGPRSTGDTLAAVARRLPLVTLNRRVRGASSVVIDTPAGMTGLGAHLAGLGHRRIAYLGGPDAGSWLDPRRLRALRESVPDREVVALTPYPPEFEAGVRATDAVLETGATAVVAYSSTLLLGLLHRMTTLGLSAPGDFSLACADDLSAAGLALPDITALHVPAAEAGRRTVERLLELAAGSRGESATHQLLPVELLVRTSTGSPATP
ncbi:MULTISPECIES: LacI family DNA-binding transcriptional regulator [Streptomyces]|uniref:LacI family DNA-binding transcriptional regulator n=1 Tax=Streptomyces xanthii TaxID=2768069 RepID=A0A7H1BG43_9ACTN|nr:LacI family DNA-binding transcriptional regulator [Streptomyces xanthii]QNS07698.1 LacI family DNA-binding transcriptional regulator [Streptomyces xanthii]